MRSLSRAFYPVSCLSPAWRGDLPRFKLEIDDACTLRGGGFKTPPFGGIKSGLRQYRMAANYTRFLNGAVWRDGHLDFHSARNVHLVCQFGIGGLNPGLGAPHHFLVLSVLSILCVAVGWSHGGPQYEREHHGRNSLRHSSCLGVQEAGHARRARSGPPEPSEENQSNERYVADLSAVSTSSERRLHPMLEISSVSSR